MEKQRGAQRDSRPLAGLNDVGGPRKRVETGEPGSVNNACVRPNPPCGGNRPFRYTRLPGRRRCRRCFCCRVPFAALSDSTNLRKVTTKSACQFTPVSIFCPLPVSTYQLGPPASSMARVGCTTSSKLLVP